MGLVFFGNEKLATGTATDLPILRALIEAGFRIQAIVSNPETNTPKQTKELSIESLAHAYHIPLFTPKKLIEIERDLAELKAEAAILIAYGKIIPVEIINIFPKGIINIHPSLLPLHRGPTPIESVILDGSTKTGVSLMKLAPQMDAGPVYSQHTASLSGRESKQDLANSLSKIARNLLIKNLPLVLSGELLPKEQDHNLATYDSLINKSDGVIDWQKPAVQLEREVRAYRGWPGSRTKLAEKDVIITQASVLNTNQPQKKPGSIELIDNNILVATSKGSLVIERLKPAGKREMSAREFIIGHKNKLTG
jgi:methionyl-tRNA formyltransferase